jgi:TolB-like protein
MSGLKRLLQEVHQRSLWQLLASCIVGAWLVLQIAETLASLIGLPLWFGAGVIALLAFGLVLVLTTGLVQVVAAYRSAPDRSYGGLRRLFSWKHALIAGLVAVAVLVVGTGSYMGLRAMGVGPMGSLVAKGVIEARDRIVVADFENHTADSTIAAAVTEGLRVDLHQSAVVRVAEQAFLADVLQRMERDPAAELDYELAREIAIREGLKAVVSGEVHAVGSGYMLSAQLIAAGSGDVLWAERAQADDDDAIIGAIDDLSKSMRERVGESLRTVRSSPPLDRVTTSSLAALSKYSQARRPGANVLLLAEEAVALDTTFAAGYRLMANALPQGERARVIDALTRAYEFRDRLADWERYKTEGIYYARVTGDQQRAAAAYRMVLSLRPDEFASMVNLAVVLDNLRQFAEAEAVCRQGIELDSTASSSLYSLLFRAAQSGQV